MAQTEAQKRAKARYQKRCKRMAVTIYPSEPDLMRWMEDKPHYSAYIKQLIRDDMERQ